jgi:hypothetical protein
LIHFSHRHHALPLQAPAAEAEGGRSRRAEDHDDPANAPPGEAEQPEPKVADSAGFSTSQRPVIVTARKARGRFGDVPDMTPEEHERRGDAAVALFHELMRRVRKG